MNDRYNLFKCFCCGIKETHMNLPVKTPKSSNRKWLWTAAIILGVTLVVMVTTLLRFKAELAAARLATPSTAASAPKPASLLESGK